MANTRDYQRSCTSVHYKKSDSGCQQQSYMSVCPGPVRQVCSGRATQHSRASVCPGPLKSRTSNIQQPYGAGESQKSQSDKNVVKNDVHEVHSACLYFRMIECVSF